MNSDTDALIDYELIYHWRDLKNKPSVIVFDLDHTVWPFYIDYQEALPFHKTNEVLGVNVVVDAKGERKECFSDINKILFTLKYHCFANGEKMAVASRALSSESAKRLIELYGWNKYFDSIQVYSMPKNNHMYAIKQDLGFDSFDQVLFFDDNNYNIKLTSQMGICAHRCNKEVGLDLNNLHRALDIYNHFKEKRLHK